MLSTSEMQKIEGFAGRESLPVGVLVELFFEGTADSLREQARAYCLYPDYDQKGAGKLIQEFEKFSAWAIARVHPHPGPRASLSDIVKTPISSQEVYSWLCKNPSSLSLRPQAKEFFKALKKIQVQQNQSQAATQSPAKLNKPPSVRREGKKQKTQKKYETWGKACRKLKRENPDKSYKWCAIQISRMPIGKGYDPETIRRYMKK
ncbi:MAG: hypothetical protein OEZ51_10250 [Nitrospinota bacterium]|nr:hypothetical protein [Nitrospinota bacterium]